MEYLYLCGATVRENKYKEAFKSAYNELTNAGYIVMKSTVLRKKARRAMDYMSAYLALRCEHEIFGVARIENTHLFKGGTDELKVAEILGYEIKTVDEWLEAAQ